MNDKSPKVRTELSGSFHSRKKHSKFDVWHGKILLYRNMNSLLLQPRWSSLSTLQEGKWVMLANNRRGQKQSWCYQGIHPPTPAGNPPWYLLRESAPLVISLSDMLVLPKRVSLKALKGFEGYMVTESVSYLKDLYLPLCKCLKRKEKYPIYLHLWKLERLPLPLSNPILSNLCNINVYNPLSDFIYYFPFWLDNFI